MRIIKLTCPIEAGKHLSMCILPTAIDCETTGLDTRVDTILSVQVCSLSTSNIIYYLLPTALHGLLSIPTTTRLVFHNFKFDVRMLKRHHIVLPHPIADTSLMHHLYDENASHRLDDIVKSFYNDNYKEQFWLKYKTYPEAPEAEQLDYACKDAYYTLRLYTDLLSRLRRDGVPSTLITHVHRLALALFDTEEKGVRIDVGYLTQLGVKHKTELERLKVELSACASEHIECIVEDRYQVELAKRKTERGKANVTRPEFNWDSIPDVRNLVYERMRLPKQTTRQKKVTLDADALEALRGKHPLIGKLLEYREHQKVYTSFIEGTLDKMLDGRIHPSFNVNGTVTGRISGNSPNLQQLPREGGVRGIYLPDEGHVLLSADFCLPLHTEYLCVDGWKKIHDVKLNDLVWQVNPVSLVGSWVRPSRVLVRNYSGEMITFSNKRMTFECTKNHRMLYVGQQTSKQLSNALYRSYKLSQDSLSTIDSFAHFSKSNSKSFFSEKEIWLACLTQADGSHLGKNRYRLQLSEPRKVLKATELLGPPSKIFEVRKGQNYKVHHWNFTFDSILFSSPKCFDFSELGANQSEVLVGALEFWDGSYCRRKIINTCRFSYYTTSLENSDVVQRYLVTSGYEAQKSIILPKKPQHKACYCLTIKRAGTTRFGSSIHNSLGKSKITYSGFSGVVGCLTVPDGYLLVRQNGKVFVTGNCQLEVVLSAHFSQDELLLRTIRNGESLHDVTANALEIPRAAAKQINFSLIYGASEFRISSILGCNLHEAKRVFEKLWDTYKGLHNVIKQCHDCVDNGMPIINAYGRRRRFNTDFCNHWDLERMKRQAFNAKVQGTGADLTNRAFYLVSEAMRKRGLGRALFLIHDELLVSTPLHCVNETRQLLIDTMEGVGKEIGLTLPLKASCSEAMERWVK